MGQFAVAMPGYGHPGFGYGHPGAQPHFGPHHGPPGCGPFGHPGYPPVHMYPVRAPQNDGQHYDRHTGQRQCEFTGANEGHPYHDYPLNAQSRSDCTRGAPQILRPVAPPPPPVRVLGPEGVIRELFDFLDMNGDGVLQPRELAGLGDVLSSHWTQAKNSTLLRMINANPDEIYYGAITPEAFEKFMLESLFSTFDKLDKNGTACLTMRSWTLLLGRSVRVLPTHCLIWEGVWRV